MDVAPTRPTNSSHRSQFIPTTSQVIQEIATTCLKEFGVSLALNLTVACFVPNTVGIAIMASAALVQLGVSLFFHSLGAYAASKLQEEGANKNRLEKTLAICQWVTGSNFAFFTGFNTQTLIHETGHSLAAFALYKRPSPQIEITPFSGGITQFYKSSLSLLGKKIGPAASTCLVIASGPAFTLMVSEVLLAVGLTLRQTHPHLSCYLTTWSALDFLHHAQYAYSAMKADSWKLSHDFVHLSVFGLHPIAASVGILTIPMIIILGMNCCKPQPMPAVNG